MEIDPMTNEATVVKYLTLVTLINLIIEHTQLENRSIGS